MGLTDKVAAALRAVSLEDYSDADLIAELSEPPKYDPQTNEALNAPALPFEQLTAIRTKAFERLTASVLAATNEQTADTIVAWAAGMAEQKGKPTVRVRALDLSWLAALLVVVYGEAPNFWPKAFGPTDMARARLWYTGENVPFIISGRGRGALGTLT